MKGDYILVTKRHGASWSVLRGQRHLCLLRFRLKQHAVAFGRAMAFSRKLALFVDDRNGIAVRQSAASLTYPVLLD
jgi:hypothetical protein